MGTRNRYFVVGLGSRAMMYVDAIAGDYASVAELAGFCDVNQTRMAFHNRRLAERFAATPVPTFAPDAFEAALDQTQADAVIVTSVDATHHEYIVRALRRDRDVITEKPMTTDADKCRQILAVQAETGRRLTVTFNYRYAPRNSSVRELIADGAIGDVRSVHFEWLLDTKHGADYFRRWHREKRHSGGLMVHKATHHFDLVNWWLGARPQSVFAWGDLAFYGPDNARRHGFGKDYPRSHGQPAAANDPFALHLKDDPTLRALYLDAEHEDGYHRDRNVFADGITIEDDMAVLVRYDSGATMSYHLTAYSPWEGYRVAFNGTTGRLELDVEERSYVSGLDADLTDPSAQAPASELRATALRLRKHWSRPELIEIPEGAGGHGGGDQRLLDDLFSLHKQPDPLGRAAGHVDGAYSILVGIAANRAFETGQPVRIDDLVKV